MAQGNIETAFQEAIDAGEIHGGIICATDGAGNFVYNKTLGERTLLSGEKRQHQLDDVLFIASATKLLTTIAALQCVEDGLLTLDGDLSAVAPELADKQVLLGFSEDGEEKPLLEPAVRPITLEMLLTHTSGLSYHFLNPTIARWREKYTSRPDNPGEEDQKTVEELFNYPLIFQPGESWMYGSSLDWAGRVVERVTKKTLGEWMHERMFAPLGIKDAQFYPVTREDLRERLVDLNPNDTQGVGLAVFGGPGDVNLHSKGDFGGHGMFITAPGYVKILQSILADDGKLLKSETIASMFDSHITAEAAAGHRAALGSPMGSFFRIGIDTDTKAGYGLGGLLTLEDVEGWYGARTLTWGGGLTLTWFIDRKNDLCGVGAVQAKIPSADYLPTIESLKQTFRHDVYRKRDTWRKEGAS